MKLTIFTPTYNRSELLERLFLSLKNQTNKDFCWIIIDDGSTDNTYETVLKMKKQNAFSIEYVYQENSGKPTAFNQGVLYTSTEFVTCIDSDDWLKINGVELILEQIGKYNTSDLSAFVFHGVYKNNKRVTSSVFPGNPWYGSMHDLVYKQKVTGDTCIVFKTSILKKEPFPQYNNEKFIPEALIINRLSLYGDFCFINVDVKKIEYQEEGFSSNMSVLFKENPQGYYCYAVEFLNLFSNDIVQVLRHIAAVGVFGKKTGKKVSAIVSDLNKLSHKILYVMMIPIIFIYRL